jgi:hypothetical protein
MGFKEVIFKSADKKDSEKPPIEHVGENPLNLTKILSPRAQELIQIAKDKVLEANASRGRAIVAIQDVYYHLLYEKYTQLEAGDICRRELVNYFSSRTLRRALPEVAKHQNMNRSSSTSNTDTNTKIIFQ